MINLHCLAERPLSESETTLLSQICSWNRKVVVILNKMDIAKGQDRGLLIDYVSQNVARVVGNKNIEPVRIFPVSGRQALEALNGITTDSISGSRVQLLRNSNIEEVKLFLAEMLSHQNIVREKLMNPLRMMDSLMDMLNTKLSQIETLVEGDTRTIEFIVENMAMFSASIRIDTTSYQNKIKHQQDTMRQRCSSFILQDLTPLNFGIIINPSALAAKFRQDVLVDMSSTLFDIKSEYQTLFRKRTKQQHRSVMRYISERIKQHQDKILGSVYLYDNEEAVGDQILADLDRDINLLLSDFKPEKEAEDLTKMISMTALLGTGSVFGGVLGAGFSWFGLSDVLLCGASSLIGAAGASTFFWRRNALRYSKLHLNYNQR